MATKLLAASLFKFSLNPVLIQPKLSLLVAHTTALTNSRGFRGRNRRHICPTWPNDWLPFSWERTDPKIGYFNTGDVEEDATDIGEKFIDGFEWLDTRDDVPDDIKKQFRVRFQRRAVGIKKKIRDQMKLVGIHDYDKDSHEARIAKYTIMIQSMRHYIRNRNPDFVRGKQMITYVYGKRDKFLNEISRIDFPKYEMLKKVLKIEHKASEPGTWIIPVS